MQKLSLVLCLVLFSVICNAAGLTCVTSNNNQVVTISVPTDPVTVAIVCPPINQLLVYYANFTVTTASGGQLLLRSPYTLNPSITTGGSLSITGYIPVLTLPPLGQAYYGCNNAASSATTVQIDAYAILNLGGTTDCQIYVEEVSTQCN